MSVPILCPRCLCGSWGEFYGSPHTFLLGTYKRCYGCSKIFDHRPDPEMLSDRERKDLKGKMRCETCGRPGELTTIPPGMVIDIVTKLPNSEPLEAWKCSFCPHGAMKEYVWTTIGVDLSWPPDPSEREHIAKKLAEGLTESGEKGETNG